MIMPAMITQTIKDEKAPDINKGSAQSGDPSQIREISGHVITAPHKAQPRVARPIIAEAIAAAPEMPPLVTVTPRASSLFVRKTNATKPLARLRVPKTIAYAGKEGMPEHSEKKMMPKMIMVTDMSDGKKESHSLAVRPMYSCSSCSPSDMSLFTSGTLTGNSAWFT